MRKLVKAGLVIPVVALVALAAVVPSLAADDGRARSSSRGTSADAPDSGSAVAVNGDSIRKSGDAAARPARRGRQLPRGTDIGSVIDQAAWASWKKGGKGKGDEDEDRDDDEDQSPSNP